MRRRASSVRASASRSRVPFSPPIAALGGASAGRALILATADTASADNKAGCLVLDTPLPGLSGLDLQRELAATDAELPIILLTGHGDIPMSARAMKAGAVEFLTKPFREQDLLDAIRHAIERDKTMRAERQQRTELRRPARPSVRASATWWPGSLAVWPTRTLPASPHHRSDRQRAAWTRDGKDADG
jgi:DNA-binding NarL/FixJ family response regulator